MSEYPWDIENMMLSQHDQPCDCLICDQIHMARAMRRKYRESVTNCDKLHSCAQVDCPYCEIDRLREVNTKLLTENSGLKATVKQVEQSAINLHEVWGRYRDALHIIAHTGVSGMSWQYDYEKCVNIAKEALEISVTYKVLSRRPV